MAAPFLLHWYDRDPGPDAVTLNVAVAGAVTVWLWGCVVIAGSGLVTVKSSEFEAPPPGGGFVTTTV
jgi:hypothetical protein